MIVTTSGVNQEPYDSTQDTLKHKGFVSGLITEVVMPELLNRALFHDDSKLYIKSEKETFDIYTPKLKTLTYGSDEYKECLKGMQVALDSHYAQNKHHPEHYANGIKDMDLIDLIEMIVDWTAAAARHDDGNVIKSIELNQARFGYDETLASIFKNTVNRYLVK